MSPTKPAVRPRKRAHPSAHNGAREDNQRSSQGRKGERVIIVAPVGQDAAAMANVLNAESFQTRVCQSPEECAQQIRGGAGALLVTEEALESSRAVHLFEMLKAQPPWSELPLIILTSGRESRLAESLNLASVAAGTATLLERPISTRTLVHSVEFALRSRRRQYHVRDLVTQLATLNQTLEQRVAQRTAQAEERAQKLRLLSAQLSLAEDRERRRIAQILHDDLQQLLMAVRMYFAVLRKTKGAGERDAVAEEITGMLERSFDLTRSLSVELAPPVLQESGLAAALDWLASQTRKYYDVQVTVEADSSANPKAADVRIFLFRAVRELLLNAVKHGGGSAVHIDMEKLWPGKVRIVVADKGPGFDTATLCPERAGANGFGLFNIRERVTSFGGELHIDSKPGHGTRITLLAPSGFGHS
jgi:signal transduction histidine kinase